MASPEHRLAMCRMAIAGFDGFEVDDLEIRRPSPSYTIESVRELKHRGIPEICWLIGADQVMALPRWREPQALLREARLFVMARPGFTVDWMTLPPELAQLSRQVVVVPAVDISSTDIRRRVAGGLPIDYLTPAAVCRYIAEQGLYRK
jgi:nicotinate-nucleotide adenylyltransferase